MRHRLTLPVVLIAGAAAIAGCGGSSNHSSTAAASGSSGSSSVSAAAFVKSVCTAVRPVASDLKAKLAKLSTVTTPAQGKSAIQDMISTVSSDLGTAIPQLQAAGTPSISNGAQIQSALVGAFTQFKQTLDSAGSQAASLPTDSAAAFKTAAQNLTANIQSSSAGISSSLKGLQSSELKAAAKAEPACQAA